MSKVYQVTVLCRANEDIDSIYRWLFQASPKGATLWYSYFIEAAASLKSDPARCGISLESERLGVLVRDRFFKTPTGRVYRIVFLITDAEVRILRVRGPGQSPLVPVDLLD